MTGNVCKDSEKNYASRYAVIVQKYQFMIFPLKCLTPKIKTIPVGIYVLKVNNRNTRTRCEICSKLTIKTPE